MIITEFTGFSFFERIKKYDWGAHLIVLLVISLALIYILGN